MPNWTSQDIQNVWNKGNIVNGWDPAVWRLDAAGAAINRSEYGLNSTYGWQIDHIIAKAIYEDNSLSNLQPLHHDNNATKGTGRLIESTVYDFNKNTNVPGTRKIIR